MRKLAFIIGLLYCVGLKADTGDTTKYLTLKDTIYLSINDNEDKIFVHTLERKQTLYSLARFYGLNVEELYPFNPELKTNDCPPGTKVRIPVPNKALRRYKGKDFQAWKFVNVYYVAKKGDNLFKIAKNYFHMPVDSLVSRNKMANQTVSEGMKFHVGWMSIDGIPDSIRVVRGANALGRKSNELSKDFSSERVKRTPKEARGVAFWQKNGKSKSELYCLHRTAAVNSIVAVTNPMKNRTAYAKVIGRIPSGAYSDDVIIIVSPSVAKMLGAIDGRFYVKIKYF